MKKQIYIAITLVSIFLLLFVTTGYSADTRYVDGSCTYDGDGTTEDCAAGAGQTGMFNKIQSAANVVNAGDTVIVKDGTYTSASTTVVITRSGTSGAWITFKAENKWGAVLDGQSNATEICWSIAANYIRIEDFEIKGYGTHGIVTQTGNNIYVYRNKIHDIGRRVSDDLYGQTGSYVGTSAHDITYDSNLFYTIGRLPHGTFQWLDYSHDHGLYLMGDNITIVNNIFYDCKSGWSVLTGSTGHKIINNTFYGANPYENGHIIVQGNGKTIDINNNISHSPKNSFVYFYYSNGGTVGIKNNLVYGASLVTYYPTSPSYTEADTITGQDPKFADLAKRDFHLLADSPAINTGLNTDAPAVDGDGDTRPQPTGGNVDRGYDEFIIGVTPYTRYFSPDGNDSNSCQSIATPCLTLSKVMSSAWVADDKYLLERGDNHIFYGSLIAQAAGSSGHPITIGSYGSGNRPIIDTKETITGWTESSGSGQITIQPANGNDSYMDGQNATTKYGTATSMLLGDYSTSYARRAILSMDYADELPGGATITNAVLYLYYFAWDTNNPNGLSVDVVRVKDTRTGWDEANVTWNKYDASNSWTTAGGDYETTDKATTTFPSGSGAWMNWTVTALAQYAQANTSEVLHMIVKYQTETAGANRHGAFFYSSDAVGVDTLKPKLVIDYSTGSGNVYKKTSITVAPTRMWFDTVLGDHKTDGDGCVASLANDLDWCYKTSASELYIYSDTNPSGRTIQRDYPYGIDITKKYVVVENLEIKNAGTAGIALRGDADNNIIRQCNIHDNVKGIEISGVTPNNNSIPFNILHDNTGACISVEAGTGHEIYYNVCYHNADGFYFTGIGTTATLKNNISSNNTGSAIKKNGGFADDANCVALYSFEDGALTTDSKGTNTLTESATPVSSSTHKEGSYSVDLELDDSDYFYRTDANLSSGFPFKSGDTNKKISVVGWIKWESLTDGVAQYVWAKHDVGANKRSFAVLKEAGTDKFGFFLGYNSGASYEQVVTTAKPVINKWYHFGVTYDDSTKAYHIRLWDGDTDTLVEDKTGTTTNNIWVGDAQFAVGRRSDAAGYFDGLIDELITFNDILTTAEIDAIRNQTSKGVFTINPNTYFPATGTPFQWEGVDKNFADWKTACSCDADSKNADPSFVNATGFNFHLNQNSPCINTGATISGLTNDYDGVVLYGLPDMGAFSTYFPPMSGNAIFSFGMEF